MNLLGDVLAKTTLLIFCLNLMLNMRKSVAAKNWRRQDTRGHETAENNLGMTHKNITNTRYKLHYSDEDIDTCA